MSSLATVQKWHKVSCCISLSMWKVKVPQIDTISGTNCHSYNLTRHLLRQRRAAVVQQSRIIAWPKPCKANPKLSLFFFFLRLSFGANPQSPCLWTHTLLLLDTELRISTTFLLYVAALYALLYLFPVISSIMEICWIKTVPLLFNMCTSVCIHNSRDIWNFLFSHIGSSPQCNAWLLTDLLFLIWQPSFHLRLQCLYVGRVVIYWFIIIIYFYLYFYTK